MEPVAEVMKTVGGWLGGMVGDLRRGGVEMVVWEGQVMAGVGECVATGRREEEMVGYSQRWCQWQGNMGRNSYSANYKALIT